MVERNESHGVVMQRFRDQPLGRCPRIVVIGAAKLGNYVALQPLLRGLRHKYPEGRIAYVGSRRTRDLERLNPWIDLSLPLAERGRQAVPILRRWRQAWAGAGVRPGVDLVINADGHAPHTSGWVEALAPRFVVGSAPLDPGDHPLQRLAFDPHWASPALVQRYAGWIGSNSIRELQCRVAWVATDYERVELPWALPPQGLPPVLIAVNGERPAKLWPLASWMELLGRLRQEMGLAPDAIGLIGGPPASGALGPGDRLERNLLALEGIRDLRGRLRLPQLVGALRRSRLCITVDSGPLHLSAAAGCPTVALFGTDSAGIGASPRDLWAPRTANVWVSSSRLCCSGCLEEHFANPTCRREEHLCMQGLEPAAVWPLVRQAWDHPARQAGAGSLIAA